MKKNAGECAKGLLVTIVILMFVANGKLWAQAGTLDSTFGTNGKVVTTFASQARANGVALQSDGKIVVAGTNGAGDFELVRYNSDGSLDTTFNTTGKVTTDVNGAADEALAVALQSNGKIIAAGYANSGSQRIAAVVRYNTDGTIDTTFGSSGKAFYPHDPFNPDSQFNAVVVQSDGKILAGGGLHFPPLPPPNNTERNDLILVRYNSDGTLDMTFGGGSGVASDDSVSSVVRQNISSLAIQTDGKIVAAAQVGGGVLARYSSTGAPDSSFGTSGHVVNVGTSATSVAIESDGKIVVAGDQNQNFLITRWNSDGTADSNFGSSGAVQTDFGQADVAAGVLLLSDGHIVAGGYSTNTNTTARDFALARYSSDGSPDSLFGTNGAVLTDFSSTNDLLTGIALQSDGKLVAAGTITDTGQNTFSFGVARYLMKEPTTTSLSSSLNPATVGQNITFTANVSSSNGTATGSVEFRDNGVAIGTSALSGGVATFSTSSLGAGNHPMTAAYLGTPIFLDSTSPVGIETVNQVATTMALTSSLNPSNVGDVVTFTATVAVVPPGVANVTGTVDFFDGTTQLNSRPVRIQQGAAVFSTSALTKGNHTITAVYSGAHNLAGSTSPGLRQQVKP